MTVWLVLIIGGILTFAIRLSFVFLLGRAQMGEGFRRALRFVPPAVLSAIILPELVAPSGSVDLTPGNYRLIAGIFAIVVAWRTRRALVTIVVGAVVLVVLQFLL